MSEELPLSPLTMAILLALADEDRHGYGLKKEIGLQSGGSLTPGTGSLYAALDRLMEDELITESPHRPAPSEDQRRKYFRITEAGREMVRAEAARMLRVLELAADKALAPELHPARGRAG